MKKLILFGASALMLGAVLFTACKKKEDDIVLPPIGGFSSSDEVGKADLLAHFPLDDAKEKISGSVAPEVKNVTFGTGLKGKCAVLTAGYLAYDPIAALTANTASYTISAWVKLKNNGSSATMIACMTRPGEWIGNFNLLAETGQFKATSDTLKMKIILSSIEALNPSGSIQDNLSDPARGGDQVFKAAQDTAWTHVVGVYDGSTSILKIYGNNKKITNPAWENRGIGDLTFDPRVSRMVLGGFNTGTNTGGGMVESWQKGMTGSMDEVRVWKKALSEAEIDALYQLEKAGR